MFNKYLLEELFEGKIDDVLDNPKYSSIHSSIKQHYREQVPNENSSQLRYLLDQHLLGNVNVHNDVNSTLKVFNTVKDKLPKKRVEQYRNYLDLEHSIQPHKNELDKDSHIDYEDENILVTRHSSNKSMIKAAKLEPRNPFYKKCNAKATWCTAADSEEGRDRFAEYTDNGLHPHYVVYNKNNGRKSAFVSSYDTDDWQLRDENDDMLNANSGDYHRFILNNKGVEHSSVGKMIMARTSHTKDMFDKINHNSTENDINTSMYGGVYDKIAAMNHPNLSVMAHQQGLNDGYDSVKLAALEHKMTTQKQVKDALNDKSLQIQRKAVHLLNDVDALNDISKSTDRIKLEELKHNNNLTPEHVNNIMKNPEVEQYTKQVIFNNNKDKITPEIIDSALKNGNVFLHEMALEHPKTTVENLHTAIDLPDSWETAHARRLAVKHKLADDYVLDKGIDGDRKTRLEAISNQNASPSVIDKALDDDYNPVVLNAARHPNASVANIDKALKHHDEMVRIHALENRNITKSQLEKATNDVELSVATLAKRKLS